MSTYVMADIHGEIDRYHAMLDLINFSADDQLYIIGDIIDRGSEGLTILQEIMDKGNVHFILGNHEDMMLGTLSQHSYPGARTMWKQNGGDKTYRELLYHMTSADRERILAYCLTRPAMETVEVGETSWTLVHGRPSTKFLDMVWGRVEADDDFGNSHYIVGHTPTCYLTKRFKEPYHIFHGKGFICIDCGCGNLTNPYRQLACLRLEDMAEYYV